MIRLNDQPIPPAASPLATPPGTGIAPPTEVETIPCPPLGLYSDEPTLETDLHRRQIDLLIRVLESWWHDRTDFYISGNLTVYYSAAETKKRDFRGPDVFVVLNTERRDRRSWVLWEEGGQYPNVVIEMLSDSTEAVDRTSKKELYQNTWRLPEYYWFHPETLEFAGFRLVNGVYDPIAPNASGRLVSQQLELELGIHEGQLRWYAVTGTLIPLPEEAAEARAEQAEARAEQEKQARERLETYLRSQGIDPNNLPD